MSKIIEKIKTEFEDKDASDIVLTMMAGLCGVLSIALIIFIVVLIFFPLLYIILGLIILSPVIYFVGKKVENIL